MNEKSDILTQIQSIASVLIRTRRFNELEALIREGQALTIVGAEPHCIALEGQTGVGKTTLLKSYANKFPAEQSQLGLIWPVFYVLTPSPVTVKAMVSSMLEQLGDPAPYRGTLPHLTSRLINFLIRCEVKLVILDDIQHIIDVDRDRIVYSVSDWLKYIIKESGVAFVIVGITGKVSRILDANSQLSRLFAFREELRAFHWRPEIQDDSETLDYVSFVLSVEKELNRPFSDQITRTELLKRLHYATGGVIANLMNLLRYAVYIAIKDNSDQITLAMLEYAFNRRLSAHMKGRSNPFAASVGTTFVAEGYNYTNSPESTGRRVKGRQERPASLSKTLTS